MHFKMDNSYQFSSILWILPCVIYGYCCLKKSVSFTMQIVVIIVIDSHFIQLTQINIPRRNDSLAPMSTVFFSNLTKQIVWYYGVVLEVPDSILNGFFMTDRSNLIKKSLPTIWVLWIIHVNCCLKCDREAKTCRKKS